MDSGEPEPGELARPALEPPSQIWAFQVDLSMSTERPLPACAVWRNIGDRSSLVLPPAATH